jgi:hypothetical protein
MMATTQERMKVLEMLKEGKITPEAAAQLLDAVESEPAKAVRPVMPQAPLPSESPDAPARTARWLRVRVTDTDTGRPRVNVRLPISLVNMGMKLGARYSPEIEGIDMAALLQAVQESEPGPFVDVYDEEDGEHVEVFLE